MDKFVRVDKKKEETPIGENEVRVTAVGRLHNYINYAASLVNEQGLTSLVLKGMGRAINKTVSLAEIMKRRVPGLHQVTEIGSVDITDTWEPKEEGLNQLEITRHVSVITIRLSVEEPANTNVPGYQPPIPDEEVKPLLTEEERPVRAGRGGGRGRQRGGGRGYVRGSGRRGRGRFGGRGRGRDSYNAVEEDHLEGLEEAGDELEEEMPSQVGRGRGGRIRGRGRRGGYGRGREGGGGRGRIRGRRGGGGGRGASAANSTGDQKVPDAPKE